MTIPFQFYITADQICRPRFEHIHFVSLNVLGWMSGQVQGRATRWQHIGSRTGTGTRWSLRLQQWECQVQENKVLP